MTDSFQLHLRKEKCCVSVLGDIPSAVFSRSLLQESCKLSLLFTARTWHQTTLLKIDVIPILVKINDFFLVLNALGTLFFFFFGLGLQFCLLEMFFPSDCHSHFWSPTIFQAIARLRRLPRIIHFPHHPQSFYLSFINPIVLPSTFSLH